MTLLFILIIISFQTFSKGFLKVDSFLMKLNVRKILFTKRKLNIILSSIFYDDVDDASSSKKNKNNYESYFNFNNNIMEEQNILKTEEGGHNNDILYTLIWFDCDDCKKLLNDVNKECKNVLYINGSYYFFDENDESNSPLFYKNDELIATDVFSIYEELFYDKKIE
jgi:hypothetical protein